MEIFDKKLRFNPSLVYRMISRETGQAINGLSEPCYRVRTKKFEATLYRTLGVTTKDIKEFAKRTYEGTDYGRMPMYNVPFTVILTYIYHKFAKANKKREAEIILLYLLVKFYGSMFKIMFPDFCIEDVFRYTIDHITKVHLFYREKTIANALIFLAKELHKKYYPLMADRWDPEVIKNFIVYGRSRVSQSTKSFAENYYRNREAGKGVKTEKDSDDDGENRNMYQTTTSATGKAAIEKFIQAAYVYKKYDEKSVVEAKKSSRVKNNLAENIIPLIHKKSSEESVRVILSVFMRELTNLNMLCSQQFYKTVKKLMMARKEKVTFRNYVTQYTQSMFAEAMGSNFRVTQRDMVSLRLFVAFYITISFRKMFC